MQFDSHRHVRGCRKDVDDPTPPAGLPRLLDQRLDRCSPAPVNCRSRVSTSARSPAAQAAGRRRAAFSRERVRCAMASPLAKMIASLPLTQRRTPRADGPGRYPGRVPGARKAGPRARGKPALARDRRARRTISSASASARSLRAVMTSTGPGHSLASAASVTGFALSPAPSVSAGRRAAASGRARTRVPFVPAVAIRRDQSIAITTPLRAPRASGPFHDDSIRSEARNSRRVPARASLRRAARRLAGRGRTQATR